MLNRDDLIDVIMMSLVSVRSGTGEAAAPAPVTKINGGAETASRPVAKRRIFLSEYDIKKRLTPRLQLLKIPPEAILSPLAADWLILKGIKVIRE